MNAFKPRYKPKYKPRQILLGSGYPVVVTGWSVKEAIAKQLTPDCYAAIGQLYSPVSGLEFLVRNLLLNPCIRYVIGIEATQQDRNAGSMLALKDFFANGVRLSTSTTGRPCWRVKSSIFSTLDAEIKIEAIDMLRQEVCYVHTHSIAECVETVKSLERDTCLQPPYSPPLEFPLIEEESTTLILPGTRHGHRVEARTIAEAWVEIVYRIFTFGQVQPSGYDSKRQELLNLVAIVTDEPEGFYFPEPNYLPVDRGFIETYLPQMIEDAEYREGVKYTYGQRLRSWFGQDQIDAAIDKLTEEIDCTSVVLSLWDVKDNVTGGSPCLNHLWLRAIDGTLHLTALFRSNDMFSAWPANAMGLRALQKHIANEYEKKIQLAMDGGQEFDPSAPCHLSMGTLTIVSQSAHIYEEVWENAGKVAELYFHQKEKPTYSDPTGNFIIEVEGNSVKVTQTRPNGEQCKAYFGSNPLRLVREICTANPEIQPSHAAYLGVELERAKQAIARGVKYEQDVGGGRKQ